MEHHDDKGAWLRKMNLRHHGTTHSPVSGVKLDESGRPIVRARGAEERAVNPPREAR